MQHSCEIQMLPEVAGLGQFKVVSFARVPVIMIIKMMQVLGHFSLAATKHLLKACILCSKLRCSWGLLYRPKNISF